MEASLKMMDAGGTWTDERVELLKKLWTDGLSASQIAAELGNVTRNAVIGKVHRLGLSGRAKPGPTGEPKPRKLERPAAATARSISSNNGPTRSCSATPAAVRLTPFGDLENRRTSRDPSRRAMAWLAAGWPIPSWAAAAVKVPARAAAMKMRNALSETPMPSIALITPSPNERIDLA